MTEEELKSIEGIGIEGNPGRIVRDLIAEVRRMRLENTSYRLDGPANTLYAENQSLRALLREAQAWVKIAGGPDELIARIDTALGEAGGERG